MGKGGEAPLRGAGWTAESLVTAFKGSNSTCPDVAANPRDAERMKRRHERRRVSRSGSLETIRKDPSVLNSLSGAKEGPAPGDSRRGVKKNRTKAKCDRDAQVSPGRNLF